MTAWEGRMAEKAPSEAPDGWHKRLSYLLDLFDSRKSAAEVARKSVDQLQAYIKGTSAAPFEALVRLCLAKQVSLDWLATGRGVPHAGSAASRDGIGPGGPAPGREWEANDYVVIPTRESVPGQTRDPAARTGVPELLAVNSNWITGVLRRNPTDLCLVEAVGDGMSPTICRGDLLLVDFSQRRLHDGGLFIFDVAGELMVKRVARSVRGTLRVLSDNARYPAEEIPAEDASTLTVTGEVAWIGNKL